MRCMFCEAEVAHGSEYCYNCGAEIGSGNSGSDIVTLPSNIETYSQSPQTDSILSAAQPQSSLKDLSQIKGWNWGAFFFTWIWAFAHNMSTFGIIALILSFSGFGFIIAILFGLLGNEYAWKHRKFKSVEEFKEVQRKWAVFGFLLIFGILGLVFISIIAAGISR